MRHNRAQSEMSNEKEEVGWNWKRMLPNSADILLNSNQLYLLDSEKIYAFPMMKIQIAVLCKERANNGVLYKHIYIHSHTYWWWW